jgi:hypothetical protein
MSNDLKWFKDRVGKRIYRENNICDCGLCKGVHVNGLVITDELHAQYLFDCQNELGLKYYEKEK